MRKSISSIRSTHPESKNNNMKSMKNKLLHLFRIASVIITVVITLTLFPTLRAEPATHGCATGVIEQYGTGHSVFGDTPLRWRAFVPNDRETHPAIIVIHGGHFYGGDFDKIQTDEDLVCAGFCVFDIEYRLAPPGKVPGQGRDPGQYPEQTDDVATAIRAARNPAPGSVAFGRVNGKVGAVGGSAGASHAAYCAAAPTLGDDQLDAAVLLSGAYDFHDPASLIDTRCVNFGYDVRNYVDCSPGPACDGNGGLLDLASPYRRFTRSSSPVFIVASNLDEMPPNQFTILVDTVASVGVPGCENLLITQRPGPNGCTGHSFELWPNVRDQAIAFLNTVLQVPTSSASIAMPPLTLREGSQRN
jgi:acetyl esterase/lipase